MKFSFDRIISIATLLALLVAIGLMLRKSSPVVPERQPLGGNPTAGPSINPQPSNQRAAPLEPSAKQAEQTQPAPPQAQTSPAPVSESQPVKNLPAQQIPKAEPQINSAEVSAAISKVLGASAGEGAGLSPDSDIGAGMPNIKDQKVTYDGDTVHGQFLTEIGGKDVWITISGHMGQKDGYATFDPTEFKVGDVEVPVSLVNPALQRKMAEERDRLKLSDPSAK